MSGGLLLGDEVIHQPVSASWGRQAPVGVSAQVGLQALWWGEGREEAGCSLHVAACRDPRVSCQAAARGFADDRGACGRCRLAFSGGTLRVCTQISRTCRQCASVPCAPVCVLICPSGG